MNIIKQNPFRILGLTGNATERELQKQISIIKRYAEVGKSKSFEYDFEFIGDFTRSFDDIQQASNKIEQAHKKLLYSLFWFVKNNQFDEIAFRNLKENQVEKAKEIWNKTLKEEITSRNYSSYQNLSTLYIALSTIGGQIELQQLQAGISLKGNLINSESIKDFSKLVTGNGLTNGTIDLNKKFVDEVIELLKPYLNKRNGISTNELISLFNTFPISIRKYVSAKFTEVPISSIENKIEKTIKKRKDNPKDADEYGEELYKSTKNDITLLKKLMGNSNVQFQMIANKLANEILQCSIDFFNKHREENGDFDPGNDALKIIKYAKLIVSSGQTKDRISENESVIQKWVNDKPKREKIKRVKNILGQIDNDIDKMSRLIDAKKSTSNPFGSWNRGIGNIDMLMRELRFSTEKSESKINSLDSILIGLKPKYDILVSKLSNTDNIVKDRGNLIVLISQSILIDAFNSSMNAFNKPGNNTEDNLRSLYSLTRKINSSLSGLGYYYMEYETKSRYNKNISIIQQQESSMKNALPSSGCYIATMAYGDYDHPQVMILRNFRDEKLANTILGRSFIKFYYATSPKLVKMLKNQKKVNEIIRNVLDKFIKHIK